ncbi:MAG: hypothetical protein ACLGHZ_09690 [Actinomycetes bacterium]
MVVTTFDASGTATTSSEFCVPLGEGRVGLWTPHATPWRERLRDSAVVSVQAASASGRVVHTEPVFEGRAELVSEGPDFEAARALTHDKYGFAAQLADAVDWAWELGAQKSPAGVVVVSVVG